MARRGWGGSPPQDDEDAARRILQAAARLVERDGAADISLSEVAVELGITRKTIYRYFASTRDLLSAVALSEAPKWISRTQTVIEQSDAPAETLIEVTAFVIEELPRDQLLSLLLTSGDTRFMRQMLTQTTIDRCRGILDASNFDWSAMDLSEGAINDLLEFLLRIIQSMVVAPSNHPRSPEDLRGFLRRWIGPALEAQGRAQST